MGFFAHGLNHTLPEMAIVSFPVFVYTLWTFLSASFHCLLDRKAKIIPQAVINFAEERCACPLPTRT